MIKANENDLFRIDELILNDLILDSIKPEAMFLFRNVLKFVFIYSGKFSISEIIATIRLFENCSRNQIDRITLKISLNKVYFFDSAMLSSDNNESLHKFNVTSINKPVHHPFVSHEPINLHHLCLSFHKINSIHPSTFKGLFDLKGLFCNNNHIMSIDANTFSDLTKLEQLNLRENEISYIDKFTFYGLTSLLARLEYDRKHICKCISKFG